MKIQFLGTGAADFPPEMKGKDGFRKCSSALIDEALLIDPGPHIKDAICEYGIDVSKIKYVINTHRHSDHFNKESLDYLLKHGAEFIETKAQSTYNVSEYEIIALPSNHTMECCHFIIKSGDKCLFYGLDGAWLQYQEIREIWKNKPDLAVLDGTVGFIEKDWRVFEHNNMNMVIEMKKSIDKDIKKYVISHMAYTLHTDHSTLEKEMSRYGIDVAYDGMVVEV